jgi:hypothetical protein
MLGRWTLVIVCACGASGAAYGANLITVWQSPGAGSYDLYQDERTVVILSAGTFKIDATDSPDWGTIQSITVNEGVTGAVEIYLTRDPSSGTAPVRDPDNPETWYGAQDVGMIGFTSGTPPENQTINLVDVLVRRHLGPNQDDLDTRATQVTGTVQVGRHAEGQLQKDLHVQTVAAGGSLHVMRFYNPRVVDITGTAVGDVHVGPF